VQEKDFHLGNQENGIIPNDESNQRANTLAETKQERKEKIINKSHAVLRPY